MSSEPQPPQPQHEGDLPELPELSELQPLVPAGSPVARASAIATPIEGPPRPPLRALDRAPRHLRIAASIVVLGSLLPWMGLAQGWLTATFAKGIVLAGAWVWLRQVLHDFGDAQAGIWGSLARFHLSLLRRRAPDAEARSRAQRGAPAKLVHPFPTGLHLLSLALVLGAVLVALGDDRRGLLGPVGVAEMGMLGWAAFTWVHIASYERWGGFNPLFPLMFLAMLFSGAARALTAFGSEAGGAEALVALLGGGALAAGGGLAVYTIVEAMLQAKREGDRKKQEALEARRASRGARRE